MSGFSYPLDFPASLKLKSAVVRLRKIVGVNTSPGSLIQQTYEWPGERWEVDLTLPLMTRANGAACAAWLGSLRGPVGSFLMVPPGGATPRGSASGTPGTPQVDGAQAARQRTLPIKTGLGTVSGYLKAGDWIALGSGAGRRLHRVLADASLSGGTATLDIQPALREAVADNATVTVANATGRFMLTSAAPDLAIDTAGRYQPAVIGCVEDLRP